ncbi:hypothetical protein [Pseudonocardia kunmingensis]|uniref:hypothetical protein n=1 Tax=Pseudonocardia kunmingensis TaxID=630975 RepID=UPI00147823E5|nr:hypothetical protein [Pseudonocardia kunmingensis]
MAVELTIELSAVTQEEAEERARQALRSRRDSGARIMRQQVRWVVPPNGDESARHGD